MGYNYSWKTYYTDKPGSINDYIPTYTKYKATQPTSTYTPTQYSDSLGAYSGDIAQAKSELEKVTKGKPGSYTSDYNDRINSLIDKIAGRKFQYDVNQDASYQALKNNYINLGQQAAADTAGQAAALTGGYGNSYGTVASNQAYQNYLTQLNDRIPELTQAALQRYSAEGNDLNNLLNIYTTQDNTDYSRYRDAVADYQTDRSYYNTNLNNLRSMNQSVWGQNETNSYNANNLAWQNYLTLAGMNDSNYWNAQNIATTRQKNAWDNYWSGVSQSETAQQNAWDRASTDYWNRQNLDETSRHNRQSEYTDQYNAETSRSHYERSDATDQYNAQTTRDHYTRSDATDQYNAQTSRDHYERSDTETNRHNKETEKTADSTSTKTTYSDGSKELGAKGDSKTSEIVAKVKDKKVSLATLDDYIQREYENFRLNMAEVKWLKSWLSDEYGLY